MLFRSLFIGWIFDKASVFLQKGNGRRLPERACGGNQAVCRQKGKEPSGKIFFFSFKKLCVDSGAALGKYGEKILGGSNF